MLRDDVEDVWVEAIRLARLRVWIFFDDPDSSRAAYITSIFILALILMSSVTFCLETMSAFETPEHVHNFFVIECLCIVAFTLEYLLKLLCCPNVRQFVLKPLNVVDLISILPFYIELLLMRGGAGGTRIFRTIRLVRVFRVIKLGSRSGKVQVVTRTMYESLDILVMMFFLLSITVLVFSTLIFFAERGTYYEETDDVSRRSTSRVQARRWPPTRCTTRTVRSSLGERISPFQVHTGFLLVDDGDAHDGGVRRRCPSRDGTICRVPRHARIRAPHGASHLRHRRRVHAAVDGIQETGDGAVRRGFRKLAPRYVELTTSLKNHTQVADETLHKMRDMQTEIDERMMRIRQIVHQRSKENQALKRKALIKGKLAVVALLDNKSAENFEQERRLQKEMEALWETARRCERRQPPRNFSSPRDSGTSSRRA